MKKAKFLFILLPTFLAPAVLSAADAGVDAKPVAPDSPYAVMASFPGGVWSGDLPAEKDGPQMKIELRFAWTENRQGLRFDSTFVQGSKRQPYTSGMYVWNPATKKFVIFYTDHSGSLVEGPVALEGNVLVHELTIIDAAGKVDVAQVRLTKVNPDLFVNTIYLRKNGAWEKFVEVHYERHS
jgi:hypothetical protein